MMRFATNCAAKNKGPTENKHECERRHGKERGK